MCVYVSVPVFTGRQTQQKMHVFLVGNLHMNTQRRRVHACSLLKNLIKVQTP